MRGRTGDERQEGGNDNKKHVMSSLAWPSAPTSMFPAGLVRSSITPQNPHHLTMAKTYDKSDFSLPSHLSPAPSHGSSAWAQGLLLKLRKPLGNLTPRQVLGRNY